MDIELLTFLIHIILWNLLWTIKMIQIGLLSWLLLSLKGSDFCLFCFQFTLDWDGEGIWLKKWIDKRGGNREVCRILNCKTICRRMSDLCYLILITKCLMKKVLKILKMSTQCFGLMQRWEIILLSLNISAKRGLWLLELTPF